MRISLGIFILVSSTWGMMNFIDAAASHLPVNDFVEYWSSGRVFLQGGNPYNKTDLLAIQRTAGLRDAEPLIMWNPPWTLAIVVPFSLLPYASARVLWFLLSLALLLWAADWFWTFYGGSPSYRWLSWVGALLFIPNGAAVYLGQISPFMLLGLAGFLWNLQKKRQFLAGAFASLIAIKPHVLYLLGIVLIFWICKEHLWKIAIGLIAPLFFCATAVTLHNWSVPWFYAAALKSGSGPLIWQTPTWGIFLQMLFPIGGQWFRFFPTLVGLALSVWLWMRWKSTFDWRHHMTPLLLLSILTSSFTWMFDWVVLLPLISLFLVWFHLKPERSWWIPAGFIAIELVLLHQPTLAYSNFYSIWMPLAMGVLFVTGRKYAAAQ